MTPNRLLFTLLLGLPACAGIVTNGGFEDASAAGTISGWTIFNQVTGGVSFTECSGNPPPHSGLCEASVGGRGFISQAVTTIPGQVYVVSFWLLDPVEQFTVSFGSIVFSGSSLGSGYTFYSASVTASSTSTGLTFAQTPFMFETNVRVDDVDVTIAPEPAMFSLTALALGGFAFQIRSRLRPKHRSHLHPHVEQR